MVPVGIALQMEPEALPGRARAVAAAIEAQSQYDAGDPGLERSFAAKTLQGAVYFDKGILDDFFGVLRIVEDLVGQAIGQGVLLDDQVAEGLDIAGDRLV